MLSLFRKRTEYFPYPYSWDPIPSDAKTGLLPIGIFATLSVVTTGVLLGWITWRMLSWRRHYRAYVGYNQYVLLIYNLLLADLLQSIAFSMSFHWIGQGKILAPTPACSTQAWLVQLGDLGSGFFVLAIALHTWASVVYGRKIPYKYFVGAIIFFWVLALTLTVIGPAAHGEDFFTRAGMWCWASQKYESERLWLHYLWIFIVEFGTIIIYGMIFVYLRKQLSNILHPSQSTTSAKVSQAARYMIVYPLVYVVLTLPLAAGRMSAMTGKQLPDAFYSVAGSMFTSSGWLDTILYTLTRRVLVSNELVGNSKAASRSLGIISDWEITTFDTRAPAGVKTKANERTVTITGGKRLMDKRDKKAKKGDKDDHRGRQPGDRKFGHHHGHRRGSSISLGRGPSPVGSTDSMIAKSVGFGEVKAETKVEVTIQPAFDPDSHSDMSGKESSPKRAESVRWS